MGRQRSTEEGNKTVKFIGKKTGGYQLRNLLEKKLARIVAFGSWISPEPVYL